MFSSYSYNRLLDSPATRNKRKEKICIKVKKIQLHICRNAATWLEYQKVFFVPFSEGMQTCHTETEMGSHNSLKFRPNIATTQLAKLRYKRKSETKVHIYHTKISNRAKYTQRHTIKRSKRALPRKAIMTARRLQITGPLNAVCVACQTCIKRRAWQMFWTFSFCRPRSM